MFRTRAIVERKEIEVAFYKDNRFTSSPRVHTLSWHRTNDDASVTLEKRIVLKFGHSELELERTEALLLLRDLMIEVDTQAHDRYSSARPVLPAHLERELAGT